MLLKQLQMFQEKNSMIGIQLEFEPLQTLLNWFLFWRILLPT